MYCNHSTLQNCEIGIIRESVDSEVIIEVTTNTCLLNHYYTHIIFVNSALTNKPVLYPTPSAKLGWFDKYPQTGLRTTRS